MAAQINARLGRVLARLMRADLNQPGAEPGRGQCWERACSRPCDMPAELVALAYAADSAAGKASGAAGYLAIVEAAALVRRWAAAEGLAARADTARQNVASEIFHRLHILSVTGQNGSDMVYHIADAMDATADTRS